MLNSIVSCFVRIFLLSRWECAPCARETGFKEEKETEEDRLEALFTPLLPAQPAGLPGRGVPLPAQPSPDALPPNWEDLPVDKDVPDCSGWSAAKVSHYLVQHGIKEDYAKVFFDEVRIGWTWPQETVLKKTFQVVPNSLFRLPK